MVYEHDENALKRQCGRESIDAFWIKKKTHTFENALVWEGLQFACSKDEINSPFSH